LGYKQQIGQAGLDSLSVFGVQVCVCVCVCVCVLCMKPSIYWLFSYISTNTDAKGDAAEAVGGGGGSGVAGGTE
jgi:hypothetical protein